MKQKSSSVTAKVVAAKVVALRTSLKDINAKLIELESKSTTEYKKRIDDGVTKYKDTLQRHDASKPQTVQKPQPQKENQDYQNKLDAINQSIQQIEQQMSDKHNIVHTLVKSISDAEALIAKVKGLEDVYSETKRLLNTFLSDNNLSKEEYVLALISPMEKLQTYLATLVSKKKALVDEIDGAEGLEAKRKKAIADKTNLIATANSEEKRYQKYLADLAAWEEQRKKIVGTADSDNTLAYYENEQTYLTNQLEIDFTNAKRERYDIIQSLFSTKEELVDIYKSIYKPIQGEIESLLGRLEDNISFQAELQLSESDFSEKILRFINSKYAGIFKGSKESREKMSSFVRETNFGDCDSIKKVSDE